jgi:hypothetical protein
VYGDGGTQRGGAFIIFLAGDGSVKSFVQISSSSSLLSGVLQDFDGLGFGVQITADVNGDSTLDLVTGAGCKDRRARERESADLAPTTIFMRGTERCPLLCVGDRLRFGHGQHFFESLARMLCLSLVHV